MGEQRGTTVDAVLDNMQYMHINSGRRSPSNAGKKDMAKKKQSMGRQRIEIKPIKKEAARQVCFSKRRNGLFKKASELATLCGAEICAVVFSPAGKVFSFGHPSVDAVAHRFLSAATSSHVPHAAAAGPEVRKLYEEYAQLSSMLEAGKKRRSALDEAVTVAGNKPFWWNGEVESMGAEGLEALRGHLTRLRNAVAEQVNQSLGAHGTMTAVQRPILQHLHSPVTAGVCFSENRISLDVISGAVRSEVYAQMPSSSLRPASASTIRRVSDHFSFY